MNYLSFNAATIAKEYISKAIERVEKNIEYCGALTANDAKQSDDAKEYFKRQLFDFKLDVDSLKRLSAELGKQAWNAREEI